MYWQHRTGRFLAESLRHRVGGGVRRGRETAERANLLGVQELVIGGEATVALARHGADVAVHQLEVAVHEHRGRMRINSGCDRGEWGGGRRVRHADFWRLASKPRERARLLPSWAGATGLRGGRTLYRSRELCTHSRSRR